MNFKSNLVKFTAAAALTLTGVAATNAVKPASHVQAATTTVKVNYVPGYGIAVWNNYQGGRVTGKFLSHGTSWKVYNTVKDSAGNTWYNLGGQQWIMAKYTVDPSTPVAQAASTTTTATSSVQTVINAAKAQIGKPYVWGASGPSAFDCSGLTSFAFSKAGKNIGRTTYTQLNAGKRVSVGQLQAGDLVFWGNYHVGIYLGNNQYIHAPQPGQNVTVATISSYFYPSYGVRVF